VCRKYIVGGRVQGVFFRASTRDAARKLGLTGHAFNLPDGNVEVVLCGSDEAMQRMAAWLLDGPPLASVTKVQEGAVDCTKPGSFRIG